MLASPLRAASVVAALALVALVAPAAPAVPAAPAAPAALDSGTALASPGTASAGAARLPLRLVAGRPVVAVLLDGHGPFDLVFDTGASGSILNADLAAEIGLESLGPARVGDPAGGAMEVERMRVGTLRVGDVELRDVTALAWEDPKMIEALGDARGVLSPAAFAGRLVTYDFARGEIRIEPGALAEGDGSVPYHEPRRPIPSVAVRVAGETLEGHLDTGNAGGIDLPARLGDALDFAGPLREATARTAGGETTLQVGTLDGTVEVAGLVLRDPEVRLNARFPWANVGRAALAGLVLTLDPANRRVRLARVEAADGAE